MKHRGLITALSFVILLSLFLNGCNTSNNEGFGIYLTRDDVPPSRMDALSHVEIADEPLISTGDIISYNAQTHEIKLENAAFVRIAELQVPVSGKSFLVCVDKSPIYWGAFWTPISSMSFNGVTIWQPLGAQEANIITLTLGYPSSSFYDGEDPRNNQDVIASLHKAGKLIEKLSIAEINTLPRGFKGYELYSWPKEGKWMFTLITGTNRTKTIEEITTAEDFISETGWVNIHCSSLDEIKTALGKLPAGEPLTWCGEMHIGETGDVDFILPPEQIVDDIKTYCEELAVELAVTAN